MDCQKKIWKYFREEGKGKQANRLEREALSDPFLYEALQGLTSIEEAHEKIVADLQHRFQEYIPRKQRRSYLNWGIAASLFLFGCLAYRFLSGPPSPPTEPLASNRQIETDTLEDRPQPRSIQLFSIKKEEEKRKEKKKQIYRNAPKFSVPATEARKDRSPHPKTELRENGDWRIKFNLYLRDSLRYPTDAYAARLEGEVRLSIRLNPQGDPLRIKIVQSLSPSCDREAIRLVQAYPGPFGNAEKEITLTIPFIRK